MRWVVVGPGVCPNNKVTLEFKKVQGFDRFCGRRRRAVQASERKFREKCKAANKRIYACMNRIDSKEFERANDLANMLCFQATAFCAVRHTMAVWEAYDGGFLRREGIIKREVLRNTAKYMQMAIIARHRIVVRFFAVMIAALEAGDGLVPYSCDGID